MTATQFGAFKRSPYWRLRVRFRECGLFDSEVAAAADITKPTFGRRMRGDAPWLSSEIEAVCRAVGIRRDEIGEYFFPELKEDI